MINLDIGWWVNPAHLISLVVDGLTIRYTLTGHTRSVTYGTKELVDAVLVDIQKVL